MGQNLLSRHHCSYCAERLTAVWSVPTMVCVKHKYHHYVRGRKMKERQALDRESERAGSQNVTKRRWIQVTSIEVP